MWFPIGNRRLVSIEFRYELAKPETPDVAISWIIRRYVLRFFFRFFLTERKEIERIDPGTFSSRSNGPFNRFRKCSISHLIGSTDHSYRSEAAHFERLYSDVRL